jgi:hypothetical protein
VDSAVRSLKRGGGVATLIDPKLKFSILKTCQLSKDSIASRVRLNQHFFLWVCNVYMPKYSLVKLQNILGKLGEVIPNNEIKTCIILGDFNIDVNKRSEDSKTLEKLLKAAGLTLWRPPLPTHISGSTIDLIAHGAGIEITDLTFINTPSDHKALKWKAKLATSEKAKPLTIPNKKYASDLCSIIGHDSVKNAETFLRTHQSALDQALIMTECKPKKPVSNNLMEELLKLDTASEVNAVIDAHWENLWQKNEERRFSPESKMSYKEKRNILKYHLYEKRDGAIVIRIIDNNGNLLTDIELVNEHLLHELSKIQVDINQPYIQREPFPSLPPLNKDELLTLIERLSVNKAIAYDGFSDTIFSSDLKDITAEKLTDLWSVDLDTLVSQDMWHTRLVALNQNFPRDPGPTDFRPIMVGSSLLKLIESRFLPPLVRYLMSRLHPSQTGFVPGMGIEVNLWRIITQIKKRLNKDRCCYVVFVDYSKAYNSVPHIKLFRKLEEKKVLETEELKYLKQIYARLRIRSGKTILQYNRGVAQGSILSPALFNIYIEDLIQDIYRTGIENADILFYADDLAVILDTRDDIENVLKTIMEWSERNGMSLNKKKSAILPVIGRNKKTLPFFNRKAKDIITDKGTTRRVYEYTHKVKQIMGVPIVLKYKYLGTWIDYKLYPTCQLEHIKRKSAYIYSQLWPFINNASADARRDSFLTFIEPLFRQSVPLLFLEPTSNWVKTVTRARRIIAKQFLGVSKRTSSNLLDFILNRNVINQRDEIAEIAEKKWEARVEGKTLQNKMFREKCANPLYAVPNLFCKLINLTNRPCVKCNCKMVCHPLHLKWSHGIEFPSPMKVLCSIFHLQQPSLSEEGKIIKKSRTMIREPIFNIISNLYNYLCRVLSS